MKNYISLTITLGLTIFAMLFGASNSMFPLKTGISSGNHIIIGLCGFLITGALIPFTGLLAMILFNGDFKSFFYRLGKIPGIAFILACMLIIGPLLGMPRIMAFSYEMLRPFLGNHVSLPVFTLLFSIITFICCYKKSSIIDLIGKLLSPLILLSLLAIFIMGMLTREIPIFINASMVDTFTENFMLGYNTLDLLGTIFFGYMVLSILKVSDLQMSDKRMFNMMLVSSLIGILLLCVVYIGLGLLALWHGNEFSNLELGKLFINLILKIVGKNGAFLMSATVFLACLTTIIALASVTSEYLRTEIAHQKISYLSSLLIVLTLSGLLTQFELGAILKYSAPFIYILYPSLITLTLCSIGYKLYNFKMVKIPVLTVFLISSFYYGPQILKNVQHIHVN